MCGICGRLNFSKKNKIDRDLVQKMTEAITHRGPDSEGKFCENNLGLGHRRLSIIDLTTGNQPMLSNCHRYVIVFNGEIYNYQELKAELILHGYNFNTKSDTEVILNSYIEWGENFQDKLNGEWAFAIYDRDDEKLFLSRDRYGIKPLYYMIDEQGLSFSSEIKSLQVNKTLKIDKFQLWDLMVFGPKNGGKTFLENVHELRPGNFLIAHNFECKLKSYYQLKQTFLSKITNFDIAFIEDLLVDSIKMRLMADVRIGTINSGGLDSSLISTITSKCMKETLFTFSVAPEKVDGKMLHGDESYYAEFLAKKINSSHSTIRYSWNKFVEEISPNIFFNESLLFHSNSIPLSYMFQKIKKEHGIKVILGGEGADEIFRGYSSNRLSNIYKISGIFFSKQLFAKLMQKRYSKIKIASEYFKSVSFPAHVAIAQNMQLDPLIVNKMLGIQGEPSEDRMKLINEMTDLSEENQMIFYEQSCYLSGLLHRVDRMAMRWGIEARVPFLDHRIVNYLNSIDPSLKSGIVEKKLKKILKRIATLYINNLIISRKKYGFASPIFEFRNEIIKLSRNMAPNFNKNLIENFNSQQAYIFYNYLLLIKKYQ